MVAIVLPKFDAPPVVETVMGVQFAPLADWTAAHAGWYWRECLEAEEWTSVREASKLPAVVERFGDDRQWTPPGVTIQPGQLSPRMQFEGPDLERMIQVQDSRFHYNWRKRTGAYPSYDSLLPEFCAALEGFEEFVAKAGLGKLEPNQWELTYVSKVRKGELWQTPSDWVRVIPALGAFQTAEYPMDGIDCSYALLLKENAGRLHVRVQHARELSGEENELLKFDLTARGPVDQAHGLYDGLELGHEAIVRAFVGITSDEAHEVWRRTR